jgi:hypothetical protein
MRHDKFLACRDCGTAFVITADEQEFYARQGRISEPTRCYACRQQRKLAREGRGCGEPIRRAVQPPHR